MSALIGYVADPYNQNDKVPVYSGWSWPASIFGLWWLLYKRMYVYALIWFGVCVVCSYIIPALWLVGAIGFGICGNDLHQKFCRDKGMIPTTAPEVVITQSNATAIAPPSSAGDIAGKAFAVLLVFAVAVGMVYLISAH